MHGLETAEDIRGVAAHPALDPATLDLLPMAVTVCGADGAVLAFNARAVELLGRSPRRDDPAEHYAGALRLLAASGLRVPPDRTPTRAALADGRPRRGEEVLIERPDGRRVRAFASVNPLTDSAGRVVGAVTCFEEAPADPFTPQSDRAVEQEGRRANQNEALFAFTDRLYRASSEADILEAGLDAIIAVLHCARASVLMFDDAGVMRFVAQRGLSETYRTAVEGHSPWTRGQRDPTPIAVRDIAELDASLQEVMKAERIGALAFVPLTDKGAAMQVHGLLRRAASVRVGRA
jgi:hypothetical protein